MGDFFKERADAPQGFFVAEAAGLMWLAEPGAVPVVEVIDYGDHHLRLAFLGESAPEKDSAREFGGRLARLHDTGAPAFGWAPSQPAWFGPLDSPFEVSADSYSTFAEYWVQTRLQPITRGIRSHLTQSDEAMISSAISAVASGAFDGISGGPAEVSARVHGDLWSGNLMWTPTGCTLIDPAAHGGHRLEDLAMLALFGAPFLDEIFAAYEAAHPMPGDWRYDLPVHSFFALLAHVKLFGAGFLGQTLSAARAITERARHLGA